MHNEVKVPVKRPSLSADFSWTFAGYAVYAAGQLAMLMLLAKLVRPEMVGEYALGLAVVYPVMQFTNLQLRAVMTSDVRKRTEFGYYLGLRLLTSALAIAIIFAVARIFRYDRELTGVILMVGVAYGIETISDVYYARLQLHDRMSQISKSMIARALLSVLGLAAATYATRNVLWGVAAIAGARLIILVSYDKRQSAQGLNVEEFSRSGRLMPRFNFRIQRKLLWTSLPLGIVVLLGCLNSSIPNFFIKNALGDRDVGIFAAIGFAISVGNMAVVSLGQSAFTRLARAYANDDLAVFGSLLARLLAFGAGLGVCGVILSKWIGREILTLVFRPEYAQRADLLPWVAASGGVLFMAQFLGFGMTAANLYRSQVVLNALANLTLFAACYLLVARQGLLGAIYAMLIAACVQLFASVIALAIGIRMQMTETQAVPSEAETV